MYLRFARGVALVAVSMAALSCSPQIQSPPPAQVDSGFNFLKDAFAFPNYGGDSQAQLTPGLVARMCGTDVACVDGKLPCTLNPVAENWMQTTNVTLEQGRSEGMAVAALMFSTGQLDPNDFGAKTVSQLKIFGNPKLQEEIAYWSATQALPSATAHDVRYDAAHVIPFLAKALSPDRDKTYRLAIAQKTDTGFARGHALVPIGYYKGEGTTYKLRVYDSNFPEKEQRLTIDPVANTWSYEVPTLDGNTIVWKGDAHNHNKLYFSPIDERVGTLSCPFAADSKVKTIAYAGMTMVEKGADGKQTGIVDGEVVESGHGKVVPAFSSCTRCGGTMQVINQESMDAGVKALAVQASSDVSTSQHDKFVSASGPKYSSKVTPSGDSTGDEVTFGDDGSVDYQSNSSDGVAITTTHSDGTGSYDSVTVTVDGGGDTTGVKVHVTRTDDGKAKVKVEGLPEGKKVTVQVKSRDGANSETKTQTVTYKSNGEDSSAEVDPDSGDVTAQNTDELSGGSCANGTKDGTETDVDCGGQCNHCDEGKTCSADTDCAGGSCATVGSDKVCVSEQCSDGVKNGTETDVDCGGDFCAACVATQDNATTPTCTTDSDCDTATCIDGRCRIKQQVVARFDQLPDNGSAYLYYYLDGVEKSKQLTASMSTGSEPGWQAVFDLGKAYKFKLERGVYGCFTTAMFGDHVTGVDGADDTDPRGTIDVKCGESGGRPLSFTLIYADGLPALPASDPMTIRVEINHHDPTAIGISGKDTATEQHGVLAWITERVDVMDIDLQEEPSGSYTNPDTGESDKIFCRGPELGRLFQHATFRCDWASNGTYSDGVKNLDESDVDCGGGLPDALCGVGKTCQSVLNCAGYLECESAAGQSTCVDPRLCYNHQKDNRETDVDCGGPYCYPCHTGKTCTGDLDCKSQVCTNGVCAAPTCSDGVKNQSEEDVDCGGVCAATCAAGAPCWYDSECTSDYCSRNVGDNFPGKCIAHCHDNTQNAHETDVDCGGLACDACVAGKKCAVSSDCVSNYCDSSTHLCHTSSCTDNIKGGDETDVDCGGSTCSPCAAGKTCADNSDCTTNYCNATTHICATTSCTDGLQNGTETDVDCGGSTCSSCAGGKSCAADSDCATNVCSGGTCTASCSDGVQDQDETGVDCGGTHCSACAGSNACTTDSDCSSGDCFCGASSGNCAGNSGSCGAAKLVADQPTTDGVQQSATFTVPASCSQVYVEAWGAGGGPAYGQMMGSSLGGAGGYLSGTLPVRAGDTFDIWVGQGGAQAGQVPPGTPGIGSRFGTAASGGQGDGSSPGSEGGGGGGLTSVQQSGSASLSFVVPAGGGGDAAGAYGMADVQAGAGGGSLDSNGVDAFDMGSGGGGAGEEGGDVDTGGTYGTVPSQLITSDGFDGQPANTSAPDYTLCQGLNNGDPAAGTGAPSSNTTLIGGDGCVILRCAAP